VNHGLELRSTTEQGWVDQVLAQPNALLNDHGHLERAAAANALQLMTRCPLHVPSERWIGRLTGLARDEVEHLGTVNSLLMSRGGAPSRSHVNPYARSLRSLVRMGQGVRELIDRLLVSALIEARSCERFDLLANAEHELSPLYAGLVASEAGHHRLFVNLATAVDPQGQHGDVEERWQSLLDQEAELLAQQPGGARMHAGLD
jgi:tRNA-(ms[2]io[6]A)-hydroxylase